MWSGLTKRGYMLPKNGPFFGPVTLRIEKIFCYNMLTLNIFEKLLVLIWERVKTDFDHINLVTVVVQWKNDVLGRMYPLFVSPIHKWTFVVCSKKGKPLRFYWFIPLEDNKNHPISLDAIITGYFLRSMYRSVNEKSCNQDQDRNLARRQVYLLGIYCLTR